MPAFKPRFISQHKQRGVAMIAAMLILTAMTILAFSSLSNTGVQSAILRNTQFLMYARNVAHTEINGQLNDINNNPPNTDDTIIQQLLDAGVGAIFPIADTINNNDTVGFISNQTAYKQSVTMTMSNPNGVAPSGSYSLEGGGVAALLASIESTAQLTGTSAQSTQTQGYWYVIPKNE